MNDQVYWACADVLVLAVQLPSAANLPSAAELRQRVLTALDAMIGKGRAAGLNDADLAEARYALVAFIDEQILKSNWPGRNEWMGQPLQLLLYREYTAGENFFVRMRALLQQGTRPLALEVYYLCLALGFRGAYGLSGDLTALTTYVDAARQQIARALPPAAKLAPHAQPSERARAVRTSYAPLIGLIAGCILLVCGVLFGFRHSLQSRVEETLRQVPLASSGVNP